MMHGPELEGAAPRAGTEQDQAAPMDEQVETVEEVMEVTEEELNEIWDRGLDKELEKLEKWFEFVKSCRIIDRSKPTPIHEITNKKTGFKKVKRMKRRMQNYSDDVYRYYAPLGKVLEQLSVLCGGDKGLETAAEKNDTGLSKGHIWFLVNFSRLCTTFPRCKYTTKNIRFIKEMFSYIKTKLFEIFSDPDTSEEDKKFWKEG